MRKQWILSAAILVAVGAAAGLLLRRSGAADGSTLSASSKGWLAARTYFERRGSKVILIDRPLDRGTNTGALVLALPWQVLPSREELDAVRRRLAAGGLVVYAYSGQARSVADGLVAGALGIGLDRARGNAPLSPPGWYRFVTAEWSLKPDEAFAPATAPNPVIRAPDRLPRAPEGAEVLYRGDKSVPAVFSYSRSRGRVIVVPADALANARLGNRGNADLLESLRVSLGEEVAFDEYHHGLVSPSIARDSGSAPSLDLLLVQILLLYLACAWALVRRFGPAWEEPLEIGSSTAAFLLGLGALHRKLRHSAPASLRLIDDAERLDPQVKTPAELRSLALDARESAFLKVARVVARLQRRGRSD